MNELFMGASLFDSNLSGWDFSAVTHASSILKSTAFTRTNYDALLLSLSQQTLNNEVEFGVHGVNYCTSAAERQSIIDTFSWTITDGGLIATDIRFGVHSIPIWSHSLSCDKLVTRSVLDA